MLFLPTVFIVVLQLFLIGIFFNNYKYTANKKQILYVLAITTLLTIWTVINALLLPDFSSSQLLQVHNVLNKAGYFIGAVSVIVIFFFSFQFPEKKNLKNIVPFMAIFIIASLSVFSSLISGGYSYDSVTGIYVYYSGELVGLFGLYIMLLMAGFLRNLFSSYKISDEKVKSQTRIIGAGLVATAAYSLLFIVLLPYFFGDLSLLYALGYIAPVFFVLSLSIAMIKHGLFDVRTYVARATTYISIVVMLLFIYVTFGFGVSRFVQKVTKNELLSDITLFIVSLLVALLYLPLKQVFNRLTNKYFFRDLYDPQLFLEQLNKTIVSDINLETLLTKSSDVIEKNLKTTFCSFHLRDTAYFDSRLLGDERKINSEIFNQLLTLVPKVHKRVISVDSESSSNEETQMAALLRSGEIGVLVRLVSTLEYDVAGVGNLLIGPKKSGSVFTEKDVQVLEIIANELVIAIENALRFEEIEQFNVTLQKKIDDATKELKRSNDKLKALDEAKDEFVSMASHQLRTPLTSIKGYISMVVEGDAGEINDTQKQMLGQALFSSQRMVYLISDLLNVSRLKTGKFVIEAKPLYLPDVVESELSQLYEGANAKNITLEFKKPESFPTIDLDEMKIRQVIMNFTDNAIYYTPSGGKITVALQEKKQTVEFTVKDSGIGVPKQEQHKLFAKFYRAENARKARPDGTGLGLFMAKKVIVAQSGSLIFESKEGKGSTFGFAFPKK